MFRLTEIDEGVGLCIYEFSKLWSIFGQPKF